MTGFGDMGFMKEEYSKECNRNATRNTARPS